MSRLFKIYPSINNFENLDDGFATSLSAVCDCGISKSYSLTIFNYVQNLNLFSPKSACSHRLGHFKKFCIVCAKNTIKVGNLQNGLPDLQIYGGPGSVSHDFKIWPIIFQGSSQVDPSSLVVAKSHFDKDIHLRASRQTPQTESSCK